MNDRLKRRIFLFYAAGVVNVFLGVYVLVEGTNFLPRETATWLVVFFLGFAAVDFYFPRAMKKKWEEEQARLQAARAAAGAAKQKT